MLDEPLDLEAYDGVCSLFSALSSPARAATIHLLSEGEKTVGELVDCLEISQPLMSQHLKILRNSRLVRSRRAGRSIYYSLADDHVAHVFLDAWNHSRHPETAETNPESAR
ncbi:MULTISPECIES: ArsR/SmtB family transcription factor [Kocuria]|uniref:ArsR/SmtB family transcription factor n=1 Tax=Kocuria TaxID=57493 RepID=UPI00065F8A39|nr:MULTISPECIES: metalloregulator ArsR/SmtB family transcription factor [Kocuria]MCT1367530.1 metalloregulator ArsR/SmtB family transcription factor [Rothia sp. p3-SID1597]RUQ22326.1 transcriptional regulator [Kocuria sp. HSID16901]